MAVWWGLQSLEPLPRRPVGLVSSKPSRSESAALGDDVPTDFAPSGGAHTFPHTSGAAEVAPCPPSAALTKECFCQRRRKAYKGSYLMLRSPVSALQSRMSADG